MDQKMRRGQVTLWVIVALVIVATISIIFVFRTEKTITDVQIGRGLSDVESYIKECATETVETNADLMIVQGGFVRPTNTANFDGIDIEYLCENVGFYEPCIQQHPALLREMEREIERESFERIRVCLGEMKEEFEQRGAVVNFEDGNPEIEIMLKEENIGVKVIEETSVRLDDEERFFEELEFDIKHPAYNLASIALEIANQEATFCYFEYAGYSVLYPRYEIRQFTKSDSTAIYKILDKYSNKEMNIAIRGCALAGGLPAR